jgi:hypothetical protein
MTTPKLTLRFAGICSHFRNVVPGVPHRVVLADTTAVRFGLMRFPHEQTLRAYYLVPHFPTLLSDSATSLGIPDVIGDDGTVLTGLRLEVLNAVEQSVEYDASYRDVPRLQDFVQNYTFSDEVVLGERAAVYVDVYAGRVRSVTVNGIVHVEIDITTDGDPQLRVTPFFSGQTVAEAVTKTLVSQDDACELRVRNMEVNRQAEDPPYDFLLHYLTARRGIPRVLDAATPGMGNQPLTASKERVHQMLLDLAEIVASGGASTVPEIVEEDLTPSCSDSRYP